jgi:uncharacterized membrane protein
VTSHISLAWYKRCKVYGQDACPGELHKQIEQALEPMLQELQKQVDHVLQQHWPASSACCKSTTGAPNAGVVTFHRLDGNETKVTLQMEWQPQGMMEGVGSALGFDDRQIKGDLERFKTFIEARGEATGAWRGSVEQDATS